MNVVRASVRQGRLVVDEPTDLPDGAEVQLAIIDAGDDMDEADKAALDAALVEAHESIERGEGVPLKEAMRRLRAR